MISTFFRLVRYKNLLMLALMQLIVRYGFLKLQNVTPALNDWQYAILIFATVAIAAAGYVINDIFDQETDEINKPEKAIVGKTISENKAYNIYAALNISGVAAGFYLSNLIGKPSFAAIFIVIAATLYVYASSLKQGLLVGNFLIAIISSLSILIIGIFDLYPIINQENNGILGILFSVMIDYAKFCFIISLIRELVKDIQDFDGDNSVGMRTLPIVIGIQKTQKLIFGLSVAFSIYLLYYIYAKYFSYDSYFAAAYALLTIVAPMLYFSAQILSAKTKKEFGQLSTVLKLVLFFGIVSILVVTLNVKYNA